MPQQVWQKQISSKQPAIFRAEHGLRLELRSCSLSDASGSQTLSRLYVSVESGKRFALGSCSTTRPFCPIRFTSLEPETTFSCDGASNLLLSGLVMDDLPAKRRRVEEDAPVASPKAAPAPPKIAKAEPKAKVEPKATADAPAPKVKKDSLPDKAVTQRTLPSGLRYEVLKRGNGPQAVVGKKVTWMGS
eukprot:Skav235149  [mRNA]  locus=scaffold1072:252596:254391:- [translate_table: standard]